MKIPDFKQLWKTFVKNYESDRTTRLYTGIALLIPSISLVVYFLVNNLIFRMLATFFGKAFLWIAGAIIILSLTIYGCCCIRDYFTNKTEAFK